MHVVLKERLSPVALVTPGRIAGAAARMRLTFARACGRSAAVLGDHSAAWDALRRRIDTLAAATHVDATTASCGVHVSRVMLELTNAKPHAERVHDLAARLLALAEAIEAEDSAAEMISADLAAIVTDAALVLSAIEENAERIAA